MTGKLGIGEGGELADAVALQLGDATHEGGDIVVYSDAVGGIAFQLDADAVEMGIGMAPLANCKLGILGEATDIYGIYLDMATNDYTGTALNVGIELRKDVSTGTVSAGFESNAFRGAIYNRRDFVDAFGTMMLTRGLRFSGIDIGDFTETWGSQATRRVEGVWMDAAYSADDFTTGDNLVEVVGGYLSGRATPRLNKAAGTLTAKAYGIYALGRVDPVITAGAFVAETYGAYLEGTGTVEGTSTVYGVYAKASGGDVNWAGYFVGADVYIEKSLDIDLDLDVDGIAHIDQLIVDEIVGADMDMNLNFLLKMPLVRCCHFTMEQGVTDITIETVPAGELTQDNHFAKVIAALDQAPGAGKTVTITITDGTNTMTVTISDTDTTGSTTTGAYDWDVSATSFVLKYSQTAGGLATKATVAISYHYIVTA